MQTRTDRDGVARTHGINWPIVAYFVALCVLALLGRLIG